MGSPKRRRGRPPGNTSESTRAGIVRAARRCFGLKGYAVATNRNIAKDAGVTAAAIYQYFDSKHALYAAVAHETIAQVSVHMRATADKEASAVAALAAMVRTLLAFHERDESHAAFLSALPGELRRHPELAQHIELGSMELTPVMAALVARGVAAGEIEPGAARACAEMFVACMLGLSQYAALVGDGRAPAAAFAQLIEGSLFLRPRERTARSAAKKATAAPRSKASKPPKGRTAVDGASKRR
jgi:AcrR family transcriptional regulator